MTADIKFRPTPGRNTWLPTADEQARIDAHWANVRSGLRRDHPEPQYKTPKEVREMHVYLAKHHEERREWHLEQAGRKGN